MGGRGRRNREPDRRGPDDGGNVGGAHSRNARQDADTGSEALRWFRPSARHARSYAGRRTRRPGPFGRGAGGQGRTLGREERPDHRQPYARQERGQGQSLDEPRDPDAGPSGPGTHGRSGGGPDIGSRSGTRRSGQPGRHGGRMEGDRLEGPEARDRRQGQSRGARDREEGARDRGGGPRRSSGARPQGGSPSGVDPRMTSSTAKTAPMLPS